MSDLRSAAQILGIKLYPDNMPQWAQDLVDLVCKDYDILTPQITWKDSLHKGIKTGYSHGRSWKYSEGTKKNGDKYPSESRILIAVGIDEQHQRLVLLHELAHQIAPEGEHHGEVFWKCAYGLYRRYGINLRYAYDNEKTYRDMARTIGAEFLAGIW